MKVVWFLVVVVVGLLAEATEAAPPYYSWVGPYLGRSELAGRMDEGGNYAGDEDDDEGDDDEDDDEQDDDAIYPPDFSKLFPNPDGRPVGPETHHNGHPGNHPTAQQHGRPSHGPATMRGPAALRGPSQAQAGQKMGGVGHRPQPVHDVPVRRYQSRPGPQYRHELTSEETTHVPVHPQRAPLYPVYRSYPRYVPVVPYRQVVSPWALPSRAGVGRVYNPWANPLRPDAYNPQFIFNPTEMRARRRFRYHPSQRIPSQRIPMYSGHWGNPRHSFIAPGGAHYTGPWAYRY